MLRLMPWYLRQPFNASFWSFSFGISALATTGLHLGQARGGRLFHHLAMPLFIFSNLVVGLLLLRTILLLVSGKLLVQVDRETLLNKKEGIMTTRDADYFSDKYGLTRTHSEVLHAATVVPPGRALDLGCGNGRNSLYLAANGFTVTAWDKNPMSINNLESIRAAEALENLRTAVTDLNSLTFDGEYDLILSTVVMMFLGLTPSRA